MIDLFIEMFVFAIEMAVAIAGLLAGTIFVMFIITGFVTYAPRAYAAIKQLRPDIF